MFEGTTILAIRHRGKVVVVGDGQVSLGQTVMKHSARKVRKLHHDKVIAGFAGATADAFTLFEKFEAKLEQFNGNLKRAAVELAKDWIAKESMRAAASLCVYTNEQLTFEELS
jgi:ATP-dependent HslUV protease subunit HslV